VHCEHCAGEQLNCLHESMCVFVSNQIVRFREHNFDLFFLVINDILVVSVEIESNNLTNISTNQMQVEVSVGGD
jgi:hypothetical protein